MFTFVNYPKVLLNKELATLNLDYFIIRNIPTYYFILE